MAKPHSELVCSIWAHIRDQGGWWRTREIAEEFSIDASSAERYLRKLHLNLYLSRRASAPIGQSKRFEYGYTRSCLNLPGQSAEPMEA